MKRNLNVAHLMTSDLSLSYFEEGATNIGETNRMPVAGCLWTNDGSYASINSRYTTGMSKFIGG